ncbi:ion transporter [Georgenia thermotolerans]|uniref:Ion transporter n=1 Tax=Georgenia thermotolerans TaxID=527326 RepID=A0A7J5UMQ5_9MICO|nr:ion transporter [Georgenia thermotolerans]KAE8763666.1 ion transporter [Georgenia thermotolerans]
MTGTTAAHRELGNTGYEIFVGALSILSLVNLVLVVLLRDRATQTVVEAIDLLLSIVFLVDFAARLRRAPSRSGYFLRQFGWADLLASLPFPQVKVLRVFRLVRVIRLLRRYGAVNIGRSLLSDRAGSALFTVLFIGVLVLEFGSLGMLRLEHAQPAANITTASDALWYTIVTMSTVGYGDTYPVGNSARALGVGIIVVGVGIFGTLTGWLANFFLTPHRTQPTAETPATLREAQQRIDQMSQLLDQQRATLAELQALLRKRG